MQLLGQGFLGLQGLLGDRAELPQTFLGAGETERRLFEQADDQIGELMVARVGNGGGDGGQRRFDGARFGNRQVPAAAFLGKSQQLFQGAQGADDG